MVCYERKPQKKSVVGREEVRQEEPSDGKEQREMSQQWLPRQIVKPQR